MIKKWGLEIFHFKPMKNYKKLTTKELLKLNYQFMQNIKYDTTILWENDKMISIKDELVKVRKELETR